MNKGKSFLTGIIVGIFFATAHIFLPLTELLFEGKIISFLINYFLMLIVVLISMYISEKVFKLKSEERSPMYQIVGAIVPITIHGTVLLLFI